mmetsp:Transcript_153766/g.493054  ORF Transcript_153766/g.493054 Transcript_153766/m.493054 type:complete len:219 (+) Transcript_153766:325-981(+)
MCTWLCHRRSMSERMHYYPNAFPALASISPRALWVAVGSPDTVCACDFHAAEQVIRNDWQARFVLLKDYVKSAKDCDQRFMKVEVEQDLADLACDLVATRGRRFNRGVVFKEWVPLVHYSSGGRPVTNEWRLVFANGALISADPNSFQEAGDCAEPPPQIVSAAQEAVLKIGSPYMTVDLAEGEDGWIALETGDGGVSGPAPSQDLEQHWAALAKSFG